MSSLVLVLIVVGVGVVVLFLPCALLDLVAVVLAVVAH